LVLWDLDGTLVHAGSAGRVAFAQAFATVAGQPLRPMPDMSGRTADDIARATFAWHGVAITDRGLGEFFVQLGREFRARGEAVRAEGQVLPGAREILTALAAAPDVVQTTVTGNTAEVARQKLAIFGLAHLVDLDVGGYGEDATGRAGLVRAALSRVRTKYPRHRIEPSATLVVGDTPHDIAAALANGMVSLGVATGGFPAGELRAAGAHHVLDSLTEVPRGDSAAGWLTALLNSKANILSQ
jgi:phosphoglycolate phosphatase-like HAD superfamily hydrolase